MFRPTKRPVGEPFEGEGGRWYTVRPNGRVVPCGDPEDPRECRKCKIVQPLADFPHHRSSKTGLIKIEWRCKQCSRLRRKEASHTLHDRFVQAPHIAKKRSLSFELTEEHYTKLISLPCHYCGGKLAQTGMGLDRINHNHGYIMNNVLPCCDHCNRTRSDVFTVEDMLVIGKAIEKVRKRHGGVLPRSRITRKATKANR